MKTTTGIIALSAVVAFGLAACNRTPTDSTAQAPVAPTAPAPTAGQRVDDAAITAKVKSALIAEPNVPGMLINVDTNAGQVTLRGRVENQTQVERAVEVARGVEGVQRVDNQLTTSAG
jgi:hyperosmotically inducible periplasmic protein